MFLRTMAQSVTPKQLEGKPKNTNPRPFIVSRALSALFSHLVHRNNSWAQYYYSHFAAEETETQRGCLTPHCPSDWNLDQSQGLLFPNPLLFTNTCNYLLSCQSSYPLQQPAQGNTSGCSSSSQRINTRSQSLRRSLLCNCEFQQNGTDTAVVSVLSNQPIHEPNKCIQQIKCQLCARHFQVLESQYYSWGADFQDSAVHSNAL